MRFSGGISQGNIISMTDMTLEDYQNEQDEVSEIALGTEFLIGECVFYQTKAITYDQVQGDDGMMKKSVLLFVKLRSEDEQKHSVLITSVSMNLNRFFTVEKMSETKMNWHLIYNKIVAIDEWKFDMEIRLVNHGVNEGAVGRLACSLHDDDDTTDVELVGTDGTVRAHGCVLAALSPFFRAAFYGEFIEGKDRRLKVPDADVATLKLIKKFAYTGYVEARPAVLATLLPLASRFLLPDLARTCAMSLADMTADELIPLLQLDLKPSTRPQPQLLEILSRMDVKLEEIATRVQEIYDEGPEKERKKKHQKINGEEVSVDS